MKLTSPITGSANVALREEIPVADIIRQYREQYQVDVARFFRDLTRIAIYQCNDSEYRFYYPEFIFGDGAFYAALQKRHGYYSLWNWQHEQAAKYLQAGWAILEIGCGAGEFLARRRSANRCTGLDLNPEAVAASRGRGLSVFHGTVEAYAERFRGSYDAVCAFQLLEHVFQVKSFLETACVCLKENGLLILSVPNNNPYLLRYDRMHTLNLPPHHAGLWNRSSLAALQRFFPLRVVGLAVEPVSDLHEYARALAQHWRQTKSPLRWLGGRMLVGCLKPWRRLLEGRSIFMVCQKRTTPAASQASHAG